MLTLSQIRGLSRGDRVIAWSGAGAPKVVVVNGDVESRRDGDYGIALVFVGTSGGAISQDDLYALSEGREVIERARKRNEREAVAITDCERDIIGVLKEQKRQRDAERRAAKQEKVPCVECSVKGTRGLVCLNCGAPNVGMVQQ